MILSYKVLSKELKEINHIQGKVDQKKTDEMLKNLVTEFLESSTLLLEKIKKTKEEGDEERMKVLYAVCWDFFHEHLVDEDLLSGEKIHPNGKRQKSLFDKLIDDSGFSDDEKEVLREKLRKSGDNIDTSRLIVQEPENV